MTEAIEHPAKFSDTILAHIAAHVIAEASPEALPLRVLDPFAGTGRVHRLHTPGFIETVGTEIEPEWAALSERTIVADARSLPFDPASFGAVATSPCYGNRMADTYDGRGKCQACDGRGWVVEGQDWGNPAGEQVQCARCDGAGRDRSRRHTYTIALGRPLTDGNAGAMQWGERYRELHEAAVLEWRRVVRPGGLVLVNMSNHIRAGVEQPVVEWWVGALAAAGFGLVAVQPIETRRQRHGANGNLRVDGERLIVCRAPR